MFKYIIIFFMFFCFSNCAFQQKISHEKDMSLLLQRLKIDYSLNPLIDDIKTWNIEKINEWIISIRDDGSWPDIDYTNINAFNFPMALHHSRMYQMAKAFTYKGHPFYKSPLVLKAIQKSFDHWSQHDYLSYNWWYNQIGTSNDFVRTLVLMKNELGTDRVNSAKLLLSRTKLSGTGQNLVWFAEIVLAKSLLEKDFNGVVTSLGAIKNELRIKNKIDGLQSDLSFFQHLHLVYTGGYGLIFSQSMSRFVKMTEGTFASFSDEQIKLLSDFVLDGQWKVTRGDKFDYGVVGRELARPNKNAHILGETCRLMASFNLRRKPEFEACENQILNGINPMLSFNKSFWRADLMAHQRPNFYASARFYSAKTRNTDFPSNGEGVLSHYLADGSTYVMKSGKEYENIFPVWDWEKIPGTTAEEGVLKPAIYLPGHEELFKQLTFIGNSHFSGSLSNGIIGFAAIDFIPNTPYRHVLAKKSWFFFDQGFIALGADIQCERCNKVSTTIDQRLLNGKVEIETFGHKKSEHLGKKQYRNVQFIYHDGDTIGFFHPQTISLSNATAEGNWNRISSFSSKENIVQPLFYAGIEHGENTKDGHYDYIYLPGTKNFNDLNNFQISNRKSIQSVFYKKEKILQAALFAPAKIKFLNHIIEVNSPCLLMVSSHALQVSDPTEQEKGIEILIDSKKYQIQYPQNTMAAKTGELKF